MLSLEEQIAECIARGRHAKKLADDYARKCEDAWDKFYNGRNMTQPDKDMWARNAQQYAAARDLWRDAYNGERTMYRILTEPDFLPDAPIRKG